MNKTGIEYLDYTWNPIAMRCTPVSPGCANCWHLRMANRLAGNANLKSGHAAAYAGIGPPILNEEELSAPIRRNKPSRIGVQFMGDLFHDDVDYDFISRVLHFAAAGGWEKKHTFMFLTKRPERMRDVMANWMKCQSLVRLPSSFWLGVTAENQEWADKRIPILLQIPAAVRFVSVEPMLGPITAKYWYSTHNWHNWLTGETGLGRIKGNFKSHWKTLKNIDLVICGGESGPGARPMHPDWVRLLRDQCLAAGVPYFFKQWGEWAPWDAISWPKSHPFPAYDKDSHVWKVGKKSAGRLLDGQTWEQYPNL